MVDVKQIKQQLNTYFEILGNHSIEPNTGIVNVKGHVKLKSQWVVPKKIKQLPVRFGKVTGNFDLYVNTLTTLQGSPVYVGGNFVCASNKLTSLEGAPEHVGGHFRCEINKLVNLVGAPKHVGGDFGCHFNQITSLEGAPAHVRGNFMCHQNPLTSLSHAPEQIDGAFWFSWNKHMPILRTLMAGNIKIFDAPEKVEEIMTKYAGQGKPGALKAAGELIRAGFKDNARW